MNPFERTYGLDHLKKPAPLLLLFSVVFLVSKVIAAKGIVIALAFIVLPIVLFFVAGLMLKPKLGIVVILIFSFFVIGLSRYVPATWGLAIDGLLFLMFLSLFFKEFNGKVPWERAKSPVTLLVVIWFAYIFLEVANPQAVSFAAWFYAMRGVALYQLMLVPLVLILFNKPKDLMTFIYIWGTFSLLGTLKGAAQLYLGVDPFEQAWLDGGGHVTHILFGKLRVFSFYSDAGQFGASQGHTGLVFGILALAVRKNAKLRIFCYVVALAGLYGMMISGTVGP